MAVRSLRAKFANRLERKRCGLLETASSRRMSVGRPSLEHDLKAKLKIAKEESQGHEDFGSQSAVDFEGLGARDQVEMVKVTSRSFTPEAKSRGKDDLEKLDAHGQVKARAVLGSQLASESRSTECKLQSNKGLLACTCAEQQVHR